ncbi:MAG: NUDIX hydrolase [Lachnospiraceae bacterium]|nr:NUDIX hydrolase [Lachnospiraceae bacterium]
MPEEIKRIKRELVQKGSIIDVYKDHMLLPDGQVKKWDFIKHKGAAGVVAVTKEGKLLMVRQYRNALDRYTIEIPAGGRDYEEEPTIQCAARELEEETGFRSENLEYLISLKTTVAFCDELIDVYVAKDLIPSKQNLDEGEYINVEEYELEELCQMIFDKKIQDSKTISAILAYKVKYNK